MMNITGNIQTKHSFSQDRLSPKRENQPAFKSIPIYNINVKKLDQAGKYILEPATFSKLNLENAEDRLAVMDINIRWIDTLFGTSVCEDFFKNKDLLNHEFYAVELKNNLKKLSEKIMCLISTKCNYQDNKKIYRIPFVQVSPDTTELNKKVIKGAGELSMYGVVKVAKEKAADAIEIFSTDNGFYKKIGGFQTLQTYGDEASDLYMDKSQFNKFLSKIENKYNLK